MLSALNGFYTAAQSTRWLASVPQRISCRKFSASPDLAQLSALAYAAERVCLPGIRIELFECDCKELFFSVPIVGAISGTTRCAAVIADAPSDLNRLHAGISGEALVLEAVSLGLGTCWVTGSFHRKKCPIGLNDEEKILGVIALGMPETLPQGVRKRKKITDICTTDPVLWPMWAYNTAECVRNAPSAMNLQPWRLSFAGRTLVLAHARTLFSRATIDMGIAMLHMEIAVASYPHTFSHGDGDDICTLVVREE